MPTRRLAVPVALAAGVAGTAAVTWAARARRRTHVRTGRAARTLALASSGAKVGALTAATAARSVFASAARREELRSELQLRSAAEVAATLGNLKGALMKLGQLASFLDEGLPEPLREALSTLQADAPPMSPELAASVVRSELGGLPDELFATWDPTPIAAASIGQVHRAITHDGVAVAVKVQYPGVAEAIQADLGTAGLVFGSLRYAFPGFDPEPLLAELREKLVEELDYRIEATNQQAFADFYAGHPFVHVPAVRADLSAHRVLTTELVAGARYDEVRTWDAAERDAAGEALFRFVFRSLYRFHAFNADPHPGNYVFHGEGRVSFLDYGLVRRFDIHELDTFARMITTMVLEHDPARFRAAVEHAGLLRPGAPVGDVEVAEYFSHFYELVRTEGTFTFTPEYASALVRRVFDPSSPIAPYATVPSSFVFIQRINMGLYAVLGGLGATANWRRVAEELWPMVSGPPSTPLGEAEAAWLAARDGAAGSHLSWPPTEVTGARSDVPRSAGR
jgi:predicted unusual protein kinase regulating ubiquinone biosynthesis (AarF/ABC1/UbiB family)